MNAKLEKSVGIFETVLLTSTLESAKWRTATLSIGKIFVYKHFFVI